MITYPGSMQQVSGQDVSDKLLCQARHLHFSSYFLQPGFHHSLVSLLTRAKELGLSTSLDPQWDPAETWDFDYAGILPLVDLFMPNKQELLNIARERNLEDAVTKLSQWGNYLVVKDGNNGSIVWDGQQLLHCPAFLNTKVVDAIGAGDSFNAGFVYKFLSQKPLLECQTFGNLIGAVSTTNRGGTSAIKDYRTVVQVATERFNYKEESAFTGEI